MAVTAPVGMRFQPRSGLAEAMMAARQREHEERMLQQRLAAAREEALAKIAAEMAEREGAASALTTFLAANPEMARRFGYLEETMPPPGPRAEHELAETRVRPVDPFEAESLRDLVKQGLLDEREIFKQSAIEKRVLESPRIKGEEARKTQAQKDAAAMERLKLTLENRKAIASKVDDIRMKIERLKADEAMKRLTFQERQKNIRATIQPDVVRLMQERNRIQQDLATYQTVLQDPEADPQDRVYAQTQSSVLQSLLSEMDEQLEGIRSLADEAAQAVQLGPATKPPTQRPGAKPRRPANDPLGIRSR